MRPDLALSQPLTRFAGGFTRVHHNHHSLGDLLRGQCQLGDQDIGRIVQLQQAQGLRFGEAAIALQLASPADVQQALSRQFGYACFSAQAHPGLAELVVATQPQSAQAEIFRDLRAQLMLQPPVAPPQKTHSLTHRSAYRSTLAVVSPDTGEGRTYVAANLAVAFSQLGLSTVLVDADMRSPRVHRVFDLAPSAGLTSVLAKRPLHDTLDALEVLPHLHILQVGPQPPNPLELLQRSSFGELLQQLQQHFDQVIVDTPAARPTADARVIASTCGQALVVGRQHHSSTTALRELVESLRRQQVDVVGLAMNAY